VLPVPLWDPEIAVGSALCRRLLAEQFPQLADLPVRLLGAGWDNTVYAVGEAWMFRFPRKEVIVKGVEAEIDLLPKLAPFLPVPIPLPHHIGVPSEAFPWPFFGARMLAGVELCDAPETSRERLASKLGELLRALHGREVLEALGGRLQENWTRRADMQLRVPLIVEKLATVKGLWRGPQHVQALLDDALALPPPEPTAVCHGDLHFRHILVNGNHVSGLIDWIDLCRGDPALDLQLVWSVLPPETRGAFFAAYGDVDDATLLRARAVALFLNSALLEYAHHEGLASVEREALASLERAASQ
jgi:aminoglycoside phosphotransferase (APT) family kinase protein